MTTIGYVIVALWLGGAALASWAIDELAQRYATRKAQRIFREMLTDEHERTLQTIRRSQGLTEQQIVDRASRKTGREREE